MKDEQTTNLGESLLRHCRLLIKQREMKNADTPRDYCFWMHHETGREIYLEKMKHERMAEATILWGVPIYYDSKMELDEIALVKDTKRNP